MKETGSSSEAPPVTTRSTFPRQHRRKDLSALQRDIHLVEIKYYEDTRPQNQLSTAQEQNSTKASAPSFKEPMLPSTPSFWEWVAPSTTITCWSLLRSWVLIVKELRNLLPSFFMYNLSTTLPSLSIPDVPFPALISTLIRRRFQVKNATLLTI